MPFKITKEKIMAELRKVIDPHIGVPITEMKLIDKVNIENGESGRTKVRVDFHGSSPFCPMAEQIGNAIKERIKAMPGVIAVQVKINKHVNAEEINKRLNKK